MAIDLSVHTMDIRCNLYNPEVDYICKKYKKRRTKDIHISCNEIKVDGIDQITMQGHYSPDSEQFVYQAFIRVNIGRFIHKTNNLMVVMDDKNTTKFHEKLQRFFNHTLSLSYNHTQLDKWYISRMDCGIDLKLSTDEDVLSAFIHALHDSFIVSNTKNIQYYPYKGYDAPEVKEQSITLCTTGYLNNAGKPYYKYNIYIKLRELEALLQKVGKVPSSDIIQELKGIIRIEKQIDDVAKAFGTSKLTVLEDEKKKEKVMDGIVKDMKVLFGKGDYLTFEEAEQRIDASDYDVWEQLSLWASYKQISELGFKNCIEEDIKRSIWLGSGRIKANEIIKSWNDTRKKLEALGISVASVDADTSIKGITTLLEEAFQERKKPRHKGSAGAFAKRRENNRIVYRTNQSIHMADGTTARLPFRSRKNETLDELEVRVFEYLNQFWNDNYLSITSDIMAQLKYCEVVYEDFANFKTVIQNKQVIADVDMTLKKLSIYIKERKETLLL